MAHPLYIHTHRYSQYLCANTDPLLTPLYTSLYKWICMGTLSASLGVSLHLWDSPSTSWQWDVI